MEDGDSESLLNLLQDGEMTFEEMIESWVQGPTEVPHIEGLGDMQEFAENSTMFDAPSKKRSRATIDYGLKHSSQSSSNTYFSHEMPAMLPSQSSLFAPGIEPFTLGQAPYV